MRDEEVIDELIKVVELLSLSPSMPANPNLPLIQSKLLQIKATRLVSKKKFLEHFSNLSQIVKQITDIKL